MELYPLIMNPAFRSGTETPWGGQTLRDALLKEAPEGNTGISCEVSVEDGCESLVAVGAFAAISLMQLGRKYYPNVFGEGFEKPPVSVDLLDVAGEYRSTAEATEAWVILNREAEAVVEIDSIAYRPLPGDVYYLPAGADCHLAQGVLAYRAQGMRQTAAKNTAQRNEGVTALAKGGSVTYYICDEALEFCRLNLDGTMPLASGRMLALTATAPCRILWDDAAAADLAPFATAVIPAALENVRLEGHAKLLMASAPDQEALKSLLDYRAENVSGL